MADCGTVSTRGLRVLSAWYLVAALACFAYAFIERHVKWSHLPDSFLVFSGDLENHSRGNWFDPFQPSHPYLWLGVGTGLLLAAATLLLCAYLAGRRT